MDPQVPYRRTVEIDWLLDYHHRAPERSTIAGEVRLAQGRLGHCMP